MTRSELWQHIQEKKSMLCVGLDSDPQKIPAGVSLLDFTKAIVDATAKYAVAFKPNLAFYEAEGYEGWKALEAVVDHIRTNYPDIFIIADAKRGDIGNTARMYAKALFQNMDFDAVTLSPYMGVDTVQPFLEYKNKWAIVLALTSNPSAEQFQYAKVGSGFLYSEVIRTMCGISTPDNMMFVAGATRAEKLADIRKDAPENFLLVPGVGAQGGSVEQVIKYGATSFGGLLINSSRSILYAGNKFNDFEYAASQAAKDLVDQMKF